MLLVVAQSVIDVTAAVSLFEPLSVVWANRSRAKPVTRKTCPALTLLFVFAV